ncbi:hypothetical protein [Gracilimonas sp.]|uniref:hypothetical protein n=1 Tax=Gracilimonas sp. TaxID=1974203 RepID=UPI00287195FB|nr:hypothetical protein [Gracilimonas sp.]
MTSSAVLFILMGLGISFFPQETGRIFGTASQYGMDLLIMKMVGALLFGFGVINFMARRSPIGGIYGRSIVMGNLMMTLIIGAQFLKFVFRQDAVAGQVWIIGILFILFSLGFIKLFFTSPVEE